MSLGFHNKFFKTFLTLFIFALLFSSCAKQGDSKNGQSKNKELFIYSPHPEDLIEYIVREFRQRTGIQVHVVQAGTGELIELIKNQENTEQFDVFWGGGVESLETIKDYFEPFIPNEEAVLNTTYTAGHKLWTPFSVLPTVIIYNKRLIPEELWPNSWDDLLGPIFKNRLIIADPEKSGSSYTILATMLYTKRTSHNNLFSGWNYVNNLLDQLGSEGIAASSSLVFSSVASGDFYAGVTFENYALSLQKTGSNVGYTYPKEGTSAIPDGVALLSNAKNTIEASEFINYVLSADVQKLLFARWQRRSVRTDIEILAPSIKESIIQYPINDAAKSKDIILEKWQTARRATK